MSEYHVASFVCKTQPQFLASISETINATRGCEVHGQDETGKIVLSIEGKHYKDIATSFDLLRVLPHLLDLSLVYHEYIDEDSETAE